jgi:hypothetical protein
MAWESAEPLLTSLAGGGQPRSSTLALTLLYKHAVAEKDSAAVDRYRERLRAVTSNRNAPAWARNAAIKALSLSEWASRDEWYLSLFADKTLLRPSDGSYGFLPLTTLLDRDPDRWISVMAKLVESKDAAVRQNAASCLVQFVNGDGPASQRRDAALPVLRWLSNPAWLRIGSTYRAWFMQHMGELDIPEAVPGLIWIVENEEEHSHWAARTLAHYTDQRAVPVLRKALEREKNEDQRAYFIPGLLALGGLSEQAALLAAARLIQMPLPIAQIAPLLRLEDATVSRAAERYLLAEDSPEARQLLLERYPNEAFITGWRENVSFIGGDDFDAMTKAEESLRAEVLGKGGPAAVYALLSNREHPDHVLRVYVNRAIYTYYEDDSRYWERVITGDELAAFRELVAGSNLLNSGPVFGSCHRGCLVSEFLSLSRQGGHRVLAQQSAFARMSLSNAFAAMGRGEGARVRYRLEDEIKGFEVLLADDVLVVRDVWQGATGLRVLVERPESPDETPVGGEPRTAKDEGDYEDENLKGAELRKREREKAKSRLSWRVFGERGLGAETQRPDGYLELDPDTFGVDDEAFPAHLNGQLPRAAAGDSVVLAANLGRYIFKDFSFIPVLVVPRLTFDSFSMWVDEGNAQLYIVSNGHLLKIPLKPEAR